ncbi:class I SAM-dependent methyltransferase [Neoroseomonas soli]|uniref:Class I SAM-dependent methyltransferase n=1 Tax=Neoroseomonas soli TaxID=1081025 RepID=A0A9X9X3N2_9PROT|nr:methyltransferase domain-containing protein [Neoroseomonas soli]MBR0674011.1 class I SAM-dependent methyltransferase [Neoroseomonas soli]
MPLLSELSRKNKIALLDQHLKPASSVLEIGTGSGWCAAHLRSAGHRVATIDLVEPADIVGDIPDWRKLGLRPDSFDAVIAFEVVEHVDCTAAIGQLCRPDGLIFLSSPHPRWDWVMQILEAAGLNQRRTSPHDHLVDFRTLPFDPIRLRRPAWIHQPAVFRNPPRREELA